MPVADFARDVLFGPLGISAFEWLKGPNGHNYGSEGLRLTVPDMAKIGQLALNRGRWGDHRLVPEQYVRDATRKQVPGGPPVDAPYGFMWWIAEGGSSADGFYASGFGGQLIWVSPALNLVVATSAPVGPASNARGHAFSAIRRLVGRLSAAPAR